MKELTLWRAGFKVATLVAFIFITSCDDDDKNKPTPINKYPMDAKISYKILSVSDKEAKISSVFFMGSKAEEEKKDYKIGEAISATRKIAKKGEKIYIRAKVDKPSTVKLEIKVNNNAASTKDIIIKDAAKEEAKFEYTFN